MSENQKITKAKKGNSRFIWSLIVALILVNVIAYFFHFQIDLTKGKRYSLTPATEQMLKKIDQPVFVTVFLTGNDLPAAYKKLSNSTEELLKSFHDISGNKVQYRFADPLGNDTTVAKALQDFRMTGFPVTVPNGKKGMTQKMVFPWALVVVNGKPWPIMLQETSSNILSRKILSKSEELLEYNLASAIHTLSKKSIDSVAYITGNGEPTDYEIYSAINYLRRYYYFDTFNLNANATIPAYYKTIIINRPTQAFSDIAKLKIDQFIMNGGHVFWGINTVNGNLDSLRKTAQFNAIPMELNLNDMLYQYGVRVNNNIIRDADACVDLPLPTAENDQNPQSFPWQYFPILHPPKDASSPIVKTINEVLGKFVSSIDLNESNPDINKTVLLTTSKYTKVEATPTPIMLSSAIEQINRAEYNKSNLIAAVLLEGSFKSAFNNRITGDLKTYVDNNHISPKSAAPASSKMIVVSDGDLIMNEVNSKSGPMDMGMYAFSDYRFENKTFLLNCIEYLTDADNLLAARNRSFEPQLLDAKRVQEERSMWQWINILVPSLLILILGAIYLWIRKRRYA